MRRGLDPAELEVLQMIQDLYGRRRHRLRDCCVTEDGETCIFIKEKNGDAVFSVNLTALSRIWQVLNTKFIEKHLIMRLDAA